jgi:hypothetical protein
MHASASAAAASEQRVGPSTADTRRPVQLLPRSNLGFQFSPFSAASACVGDEATLEQCMSRQLTRVLFHNYQKPPVRTISCGKKLLFGCSNDDIDEPQQQGTWVIGDRPDPAVPGKLALEQPVIFGDVGPRDCQRPLALGQYFRGVSEAATNCTWGRKLVAPTESDSPDVPIA